MHRVFCATPAGLEAERQAFYDVMGEFNAAEAMPRGILMVAVSLPPTTDKRRYEQVMEENVRACRYYLQVLEADWGPPERNFERDFSLARECVDDPAMPMREAAVLFKKTQAGTAEPPMACGSQRFDFAGVEEFRGIVRALLGRWLETLAAPVEQA